MIKEKIGIFGCSADPFTLAHREIVKEVLKQKLVDSIVIVPTIVDYHRGDKLPWLSNNEKFLVISNLTKDLKHVLIDKTELERKNLVQLSQELQEHAIENWRFIDTLLRIKLEHLSKNQVDKEFYPIIGGDSLDNFKTWFAWKDILKQSNGLIAVERNNKQIDVEKFIVENPEFAGKLKAIKINGDFSEMSASDMREKWRNQHLSNYLDWTFEELKAREAREINNKNDVLLHTPIFDVVKGQDINGLRPIKIDAPDWISIMVIREGKLLVEKQFRYGANDYVEEFPCGMVEKGEDPLDAAVRELEEETGIKLLDKTEVVKLGQTNPNPAFMTNKMHYFFINLDYAKYEHVDQKLDEHEQIEISWKDARRFMFDLADDAHACGVKQVPAIALAMVKLYENSFNYPSCGG